MEDKLCREHIDTRRDVVPPEHYGLLEGYAHLLHHLGSKSKRVSHSTSHAESLIACKSHQTTHLLNMRITEIVASHMLSRLHRVKLTALTIAQDQNIVALPMDHVTDCNDLFLLATGQKGIPTDKSQRLTILSIREERLSGRIRRFYHYPTTSIVSDSLTKPGTFPLLLRFLSSGFMSVVVAKDKHISARQVLSLIHI
eukprot:6385842-Pyramimonas_sp.AAC.1